MNGGQDTGWHAVEAESGEEAMANWESGDHVITEAFEMEPVSARVVED